MKFFDGETINQLMTFPVLIDAMESAHRRAPILVADTILGDLTANYFVRNALDPGRYVGSKLITSTPANLERGDLPAVQAVSVIFDATDGHPIAVMDGTVLTQWRTAADSALGARLLARPDVEHLLIVGAGAMALLLARAHLAVHPTIEHVSIWNRTPDRAQRVAADLTTDGIRACAVTDLDAADIISTCTRATEPLINGILLRPGTHIDLVGSFTPPTREADDHDDDPRAGLRRPSRDRVRRCRRHPHPDRQRHHHHRRRPR